MEGRETGREGSSETVVKGSKKKGSETEVTVKRQGGEEETAKGSKG